jgi:hypothetical protein
MAKTKKPNIVCEIVTAVFTDEEGSSVKYELPAFTVESSELENRINSLAHEYLERSLHLKSPVSLADYALWIVRHASYDPTEMKGA